MFSLQSPESLLNDLRLRLRAERLRLDMTQSELAGRVGVAKLTISRFENTGRTPVLTVLRIAEGLGQIALFQGIKRNPESLSIGDVMAEYKPARLRARSPKKQRYS